MGLILGVDFDETLVERGPPISWRPQAREVLKALRAAGHQLVLYTGRATPRHALGESPAARLEADEFWRTGQAPADMDLHWRMYADMRDFLQREGCWDLFDVVWQRAGKPAMCDYFIDDKAILPDWLAVWRQLGVPSG